VIYTKVDNLLAKLNIVINVSFKLEFNTSLSKLLVIIYIYNMV